MRTLGTVLCGAAIAWAIGLPTPHRRLEAQVLRDDAVIADTGGRLREITIHYNPETHYQLRPVYRDLFLKLPERMEIKVLCPSGGAVDRFIRTFGARAARGVRTVTVIDMGRELTIWARDRRLTRERRDTGQPSVTMVPAEELDADGERRNERLLPRLLNRLRLAAPPEETELRLEGGNVVTSTNAFVGMSVLEENADLGLSESEMRARLEELLGRHVVLVHDGRGAVPWCHIDMYLTPISSNTVLVGSPTLAWGVLEKELGRTGSDDSWDLVGLIDEAEWGLGTTRRYDGVADFLEGLGYRVIRIPLVAGPMDEWAVSYNNVLMQDGDVDAGAGLDGRRIVYLPIYGMPCLDAAAEAVYEDLGFEVRTIDASLIYRSGGAVRCLVNVTSRERPAPNAIPEPPGIRVLTAHR